MGEIDIPLSKRIVQAAELAPVVAGDALEYLREQGTVLAAQGFKPFRHAFLRLS